VLRRPIGDWGEVTVDATTADDEWGLNTVPNPWQLVVADGSCFEVAASATGVDGPWTLTETPSPP
jgi:hypothetical protein